MINNEIKERMELLQLSKSCQSAFLKHNNIWESEGHGSLYELDDKGKRIVKEFNEIYPKCRVYHVIHNYAEFGELYNLLYVSEDDTEEWENDKQDIKEGYVFAYVKNVDAEWCSEFGTIYIQPMFGGLKRIG